MEIQIREAWEKMLSFLEEGRAVVVAQDDQGLPTLHNFYRQNPEKAQQYWETIKHLGFGCFKGYTEHGEFQFCGGGAMHHVQTGSRYLSWSPVDGSPEVIADLDYDIEKAKETIKAKLAV